MTTPSLATGSNGRLLLIGGALPALIIGLLLVIAGLAFIPAAQRPTSGVADLGPGFAFFFAIVLLPAGLLIIGLVVLSRLPIRPLAILGGYGNLLIGILWVALLLGFGAREQQWLAGIMGALPGGLFLFTGLTGLAGWVQRGMTIPGWAIVMKMTVGLLGVAIVLGLVSGIATRSRRVVLIEAGDTIVWAVDWMPSSGLLLSGDEDGRLQQWQNNAPTTVAQLDGRILTLAMAPTETAVAVSLPEKVLLLDPVTWEIQFSLPQPDETAHSLAWSPDGKLLATAVNNKTIYVYGADSGELVQTFKSDVGGVGQEIDWSPDGAKLAYTVGGGYVIVWDVASGAEIANWRPNGRMGSVAWSPDGTKLAYHHITSIGILDATTGDMLANYDATDSNLEFVAWSPDGSKLAAGSTDGDVVVVDAGNGRSLFKSNEQEKMIVGLSWSPDGSQLATSSRDGQLIVWTVGG